MTTYVKFVYKFCINYYTLAPTKFAVSWWGKFYKYSKVIYQTPKSMFLLLKTKIIKQIGTTGNGIKQLNETLL